VIRPDKSIAAPADNGAMTSRVLRKARPWLEIVQLPVGFPLAPVVDELKHPKREAVPQMPPRRPNRICWIIASTCQAETKAPRPEEEYTQVPQ